LLEEGGVFNGGPDTWQKILLRRLDPRGMAADDTVCAWGDWQRDYYASLGTAAEVVTTGHPRFDLLRPQYRPYFDAEAKAIRERWGDFILVNTNITRANNMGGLPYWFGDRRFYQPENYESRTALIDHWAHQATIMGHFVRLVNRLAHDFPDTPFIIRPHPIEKIENYEAFFKEIPNVHVVREGGIGAWLLAARAMIHDGCTTGLEAHLAEVPIINFKAIEDERYYLFLPNAFGTRAASQVEAVKLVEQAIRGELKNPDSNDLPHLATALMHNLEHETLQPFAERIAARAETFMPQRFAPPIWARRERVRAARERWGGKKRGHKWRALRRENLEPMMEAAMRVANKRVRWTLWNDTMLSVDSE
jgi:surface carbohydrate biosynthesis protein